MIPEAVYGIVLNDEDERDRLAAAFVEKPYAAPGAGDVAEAEEAKRLRLAAGELGPDIYDIRGRLEAMGLRYE